MAKHLLHSVLVRVLGEFVDVNEESLTLAVWSGQIVLHDLKLKTDKLLRDYNFYIVHGTIKTLSIIIPWTSLLNNPIKITVDGVYLQVGPLDVSELDKVEVLRKMFEDKIRKLKLVDDYMEIYSSVSSEQDQKNNASNSNSNSNKNSKSRDSYMQQWVSKVIDNVEVSLNNVHFRYEDSMTVSGKLFAVGMTLASFKVYSCDDDWNEAISQKSSTSTSISSPGASTSMKKLANIYNVGVYWTVESESFENLSIEAWEKSMQQLIYVKSGSITDNDLQYLMLPYNNLVLKFTRNRISDIKTPKFDIEIQSTNLRFAINSNQYAQAFELLDRINSIEKPRQPFSYRPEYRPIDSEYARKWWKYAVKMVILRPKYIRLVKLKRKTKDAGRADLFTVKDINAMTSMERRMSFETLKIFRQRAFLELDKEAKKQLQQMTDESVGWWGGWGAYQSSPPPKDPLRGNEQIAEDISIEAVLTKLNSSEGSHGLFDEANSVRLTLISSASLNISMVSNPLASCKMSLSLNVLKTPASLSFTSELRDITIVDKYTVNPVIKYILAVKRDSQVGIEDKKSSQSSSNPTCSVSFKSSVGKSAKLKISALPIELSWNKDCVQMLIAMFKRPITKCSKKVAAIRLKQFYNNNMRKTQDFDDRRKSLGADGVNQPINFNRLVSTHLNQFGTSIDENDFEIVFEANAPKIILPEISTVDNGYLLLDAGHLMVQGGFGPSGIALNLTLRDINAGMPLKLYDLYNLKEKSLYLIKPFDIVMKVQNKDKTLSDLSINMEIQPELRGEIDSWKLGRLLKILNVVSSTFATPQSMQTSINDHQKIIGSRKSSNLFSPMNAIESSKPFTNPEGTFSPSTKIGQDLNSPHDSQKSRNSPIGRLSLSGTPNKALQLHSQTSPSCKVEEIDPNRVFLSISILMPMATLDLTYDDENGEHLILSITKMTSTLLNRAYDRQLLFDLSEIYMRDSFRAEAQQDLMWTPADGGNLIHIAYRNMFSTLSPLYKKHGTELVINFAVLGLNTDSSTITHLKPFYEVLLSARNTNHTMQNERNVGAHDHAITQLRDIDLELDTSFDRGETNQLLNSVMSPTTNPAPDRPSGVHVVASLGKISLDILRSSVQEKKGQLLEPAFAMEVSNLSADVDVAELITATVILKSFEIQDKRVSSRDYLFKKVFCPVLEDAGEAFSPISDIHSPTTIESYDARSMEMPLATNLLNIQYVQESKANSNVNITVSNVTSFISVDAILDLINVGLANTFALLDVLARKDTGIPQGYDSVDSLSSVEQSIADHSSNQPKDESKTNTMNVTVKVNNPQMILLEDPTSSESQAIVGRCGIEVTYTRMLRTWEHLTTQELVESLHVSLTNYEIFVLHSMQQKDRLHPILEPLGVELFLKRESVDKVAMFTKISIEHDSINARLSFNNLLLAQSILSRRSLVSEEEKGVKPEPKSDNFGKAVKQIPKLTRTNSAVRGNRSRSSSAITRPQMLFDLNLTSFHIIVINDFNNQNVPIMRLFSDNCKVSTEYFPAYLRNEAALSCHGSVETKIDYYNSPLTVWEPVLDSWRPTLDVTSSGISYSLVIKSEHTMQLTVSGIMLETLLRSYSLFFHNIDLNDHDESEVNSGVSVRNLLGDNIDIELFNSATKQSVMKLAAGELKKMPTEPTRGRKNWNKTFHIPSAVDLYFGGTLGEERMPLFHLPFTLNKPKPCILQPIVNLAHLLETSPHSPLARTLSVTATSYKKSSAVIVLEPIVEEVYENSRYDPIQGAWRPPFLMGDPYQWTDASCTINRDIGKLEKTSDRWEWQGKWEVDLQGVIGSEIDKDGWEYAPSFASFSIISKRRNIKPLDVARRRRWTRTRVPVAGHSEQISIRPMTAFWDVQPMKNGSRIVDIRSGMQLVNDLPFPVVIALRHSSWLELKTYGPLLSGSTFSIPILAVYANFIRIKPASDVYSWSQFTACTIHGYESYAVRDLKCDGSADSSVCFRMISRQSDKALTMTLVPYITISNRLPCDLRFRCYSTEVVKEEGIIVTGTRKKLSYISTATDAQIALKLGKFSWSQRISIQSDSDYFETIVMDIRGSDEKPGNRLALTLKGSLGVDHSVELEVFSKQILVDRTALDLFVSSKLMNEHRILRSTCSFQSAAVQNFSSIASFGTQSKDEYSLKSNDINIAGRFDGKEENSVNLLSLISTPRGLDDTKLRAVSQESDTNSSHVLHIADPDSIYNLIKDLRVNSTGKYRFSRANIGTGVYSDHDTIWKHLPVICRGKHALMTANSDRKSRANKIITFRMELSCCILLLVDLQLNLRWLGVDGYSRVSEIAISRSVSVGLKGHVVENHYAVYGKFYKEGEFVELRSNANNEKCGSCMYSVFIIPETTFENAFHSSVRSTPAANAHDTSSLNETIDRLSVRKVFEELSYQRRYCREIAERCWTEGGGAITLFHAEDNVIHLGACKGTAWSEKIGIDMMKRASTMGSVEIDNPYSQISYQLTYKMQYLPGLYSQTQMVTVMPRYCILNCMDESIWVSQRISERYWEFQPYVSEGWHKLDSTYGTGIRFRTSSTIWSLGSVDINEIGTSSLYIPYRHTFGDEKGIVLHVEVKLANPYENCSIIVVIWKEQRHYKSNSMTIENDSSIPIIVRQAGLEEEHDLAGREQLFDILVLPNSKVPFGWADPESSSELLVAAGPVMNSKNRRIATINMLTSDQMMRLPYNFGGKNAIKGEILLSVITRNGVRILHVASFQPMNDYFDETGKFIVDQSNSVEKQTPDDMSIPTYSFNVVFSSVGVSLVVEKPIRREFLSLYVDDLELKLKLRGNLRSVEFMIMDLQVDNYSETVIHPVLLRSTKKEIHYSFTADDSSYLTSDANENADISKLVEEVPFVEFTLVQEVVDDSSPIYKYAAIRILPLAVELDSGTVRLLFTDLLDDLKILTQSQALAISMPHKWINEFNENILSPYTKNCLIDVYQSKVQAQKSKIFFKKLTIHPVKITVTFIQTIFPRRYQKETLQSTALNVSMSLVGVENLQLRLKSFDVEDALESQNSLFAMIVTKSQQDILSQLTQIAGSLAVFGSPIGFARKVGKGVKAFFYEPYLGAVHGSQDFIMGLGRGTTSLFSGIVTGTMDSAVAIAGTATKGMSFLSGDSEYVRKRALKRQLNRANRGGILEGFIDGGESVLSGLASGAVGLVSKPIAEASTGGVQGFFRGIGLGLLGAAVKPMMGFTDGLTSIASGISNQVDPHKLYVHVRPPRALESFGIDGSNLVITPLNLQAAYQQQIILRRAKQNKYEDSFLAYIPLDKPDEYLVLSTVYVFWKRKSLWGRVWANISHCVYMTNAVGIVLYSGSKPGAPEIVVIPCGSVNCAKTVYVALAQNANRMGNAGKLVPVDIVLSSSARPTSGKLTEQNLRLSSTAGMLSSTSNHDLVKLGAVVNDVPGKGPANTIDSEYIDEQLEAAKHIGEIDGYRFGSANRQTLIRITGSETDILQRAKHYIERGFKDWKHLDEIIWRLIWEWECVHTNLNCCRCCVTLFINRSDSPVQISRVQIVHGKNVIIMGSTATGYEPESRLILPQGVVVVFIYAFPQSPIEVGHLKANINTAAFNAVVASTLRESFCVAKGGFITGFIEKSVSEWWCKYVVVIS